MWGILNFQLGLLSEAYITCVLNNQGGKLRTIKIESWIEEQEQEQEYFNYSLIDLFRKPALREERVNLAPVICLPSRELTDLA